MCSRMCRAVQPLSRLDSPSFSFFCFLIMRKANKRVSVFLDMTARRGYWWVGIKIRNVERCGAWGGKGFLALINADLPLFCIFIPYHDVLYPYTDPLVLKNMKNNIVVQSLRNLLFLYIHLFIKETRFASTDIIKE